ncbi:5-deoxy-glucuronate isomerase [Pseudodesulfovibrio thermohalotolerans]|uniref:5-deoxy-glucuronate isomerase n=1 Tax=Pseudodesulfovibrio thermohalotolerans TaxID=2880651 RepID=UPI0022BA111A|nr:5-deoxy-glucuronate isomerase [Pseudodesulfovibrio thermohalotolerans]WFS63086.1 5-deoxy-glucuronate isomerase [Pseudodesulfovibrio thermohalotolerans]
MSGPTKFRAVFKRVFPGAADPARFYILSAPAHTSYPTTHIVFADAEPVTPGEMENSNRRTIRKYIHPGGVHSCQLVMGMTTLDTGSGSNSSSFPAPF